MEYSTLVVSKRIRGMMTGSGDRDWYRKSILQTMNYTRGVTPNTFEEGIPRAYLFFTAGKFNDGHSSFSSPPLEGLQ